MKLDLVSVKQTSHRQMQNKVPEVTVYFWIIKILATTVGETAADFFSMTLHLGEAVTGVLMAAVLALALYFQFRAIKYVPAIYWLAVVLISIVGTLLSDNLVDNLGVPLQVTTPLFAVLLGITFSAWYFRERTLSIHTIFTARRERFYWLAILATFALGTSGGDLLSEGLRWGYFNSLLIFAGAIGVVAFLHFAMRLNAVLAFWSAYVLTRPLGASLGDLMSQPRQLGGLGLGTVWTSAAFLLAILALVSFLAVSGIDRSESQRPDGDQPSDPGLPSNVVTPEMLPIEGEMETE